MTPTINAYSAAFKILRDAGLALPQGMIVDKLTFTKLVKESGMLAKIVSAKDSIGEIKLDGVRIRESRN